MKLKEKSRKFRSKKTFSIFNFQFYIPIILFNTFLGKSNIRIEIFPKMGYNGSSKTQN